MVQLERYGRKAVYNAVIEPFCLRCFGTVGRASGKASGL